MRTIFSPSNSTLQALALENAAEVQRYIGYVKQQECMFDALTHGADKVVQHDDGAFSFQVSREGVYISVNVAHSEFNSGIHAYTVRVVVTAANEDGRPLTNSGFGFYETTTLKTF